MSKTRAKELQRQLSDELRSMARLLEDEQIISDAGELKRAADNCKIYADKSIYYWTYEVSNLIIGPLNLKENRIRHSRPRTLKEITIFVDINLTGQCLKDGDFENPFEDLAVNLEILGETNNGDSLSCAWHLDRNPNTESQEEDDDNSSNDDEENESGLFAHPIYHFHCGGSKIWPKKDEEFGTHLLLESPRLAHPPLDAILTIDFILSNYVAKEWRRLRRESGTYRDLVETAQKRYWHPYAIAAASHWPNHILPKDWGPNLVWPQMAPLAT